MIKQLLDSPIAKYRDLSVSQMNHDLLATDKWRCFVQPHPKIVNNPTRFQIEWNYHEVKLHYFPKGLAFHS